jgi:hypothetical protein
MPPGISRQTGSEWLGRFRREGEPGLADRRSVVHRQARAHPVSLVGQVRARRLELHVWPHVLGWEAGIARSTVYAFLRHHGLSGLDRLAVSPGQEQRPARASARASSSTSTPGGLGRIRSGGGHRVHGHGLATSTAGSAGIECTSRSTTTRGSPTGKSGPTGVRRPRPRSCTGLGASTRPSRSPARPGYSAKPGTRTSRPHTPSAVEERANPSSLRDGRSGEMD